MWVSPSILEFPRVSAKLSKLRIKHHEKRHKRVCNFLYILSKILIKLLKSVIKYPASTINPCKKIREDRGKTPKMCLRSMNSGFFGLNISSIINLLGANQILLILRIWSTWFAWWVRMKILNNLIILVIVISKLSISWLFVRILSLFIAIWIKKPSHLYLSRIIL